MGKDKIAINIVIIILISVLRNFIKKYTEDLRKKIIVIVQHLLSFVRFVMKWGLSVNPTL